jgi:adenylylsulfate kinase-like enzyme
MMSYSARATVLGIEVPYEEPLYPEVTVDSDKLNPS